MIELYSDINENVRNDAVRFWQTAINMPKPKDAAKFLNDSIKQYREMHTEAEVDFLDFYFQMQMEMVKNEANDNFKR